MAQRDSGLGLDAQRAAVQAYVDAQGWAVDWYADEGASGKSLDRPGLTAALAALNRGDADVLVVAKLDRLSRSLQDFSGVLATARKQRWAVVAVDLGLDTTTTTVKLVANIMALVAEREAEVISKRTSAALRAAWARGVHVGRPRALSLDAETRLFGLRAAGLSFARVAEQLNAEAVPPPPGAAGTPPPSRACCAANPPHPRPNPKEHHVHQLHPEERRRSGPGRPRSAARRDRPVCPEGRNDLRHTYASPMLAAGFKPYEVSRWMGHASVSTADGVYGHLYPVDYAAQIDRFERYVAEG